MVVVTTAYYQWRSEISSYWKTDRYTNDSNGEGEFKDGDNAIRSVKGTV